MPEISIIIPIYNAEKYIERCISSILNQSFRNFELILVIDGSPDNSLSICNELSKQDNRIRVIAQENGGAHSARKAGFKASTAPYITFVDADDTLPHNALEILYTEIKKGYDIVKGADSLHCNFKIKMGNNRVELNNVEFVEGIYVDNIAPFLWGTLYNKKIFNEYIFDLCINNGLIIGEDWITNLYIGKRINKALVINTPVYNYFTNKNSIMNSFTISDEYANRIDKINEIVLGNDSQWNYMKLLKKAKCIGNFFNPSRSFSPDVYKAFKTFVEIYGISPLCNYIEKQYLYFSKYEYLYRVYSWCYRKAKGLARKNKNIIK